MCNHQEKQSYFNSQLTQSSLGPCSALGKNGKKKRMRERARRRVPREISRTVVEVRGSCEKRKLFLPADQLNLKFKRLLSPFIFVIIAPHTTR